MAQFRSAPGTRHRLYRDRAVTKAGQSALIPDIHCYFKPILAVGERQKRRNRNWCPRTTSRHGLNLRFPVFLISVEMRAAAERASAARSAPNVLRSLLTSFQRFRSSAGVLCPWRCTARTSSRRDATAAWVSFPIDWGLSLNHAPPDWRLAAAARNATEKGRSEEDNLRATTAPVSGCRKFPARLPMVDCRKVNLGR